MISSSKIMLQVTLLILGACTVSATYYRFGWKESSIHNRDRGMPPKTFYGCCRAPVKDVKNGIISCGKCKGDYFKTTLLYANGPSKNVQKIKTVVLMKTVTPWKMIPCTATPNGNDRCKLGILAEANVGDKAAFDKALAEAQCCENPKRNKATGKCCNNPRLDKETGELVPHEYKRSFCFDCRGEGIVKAEELHLAGKLSVDAGELKIEWSGSDCDETCGLSCYRAEVWTRSLTYAGRRRLAERLVEGESL